MTWRLPNHERRTYRRNPLVAVIVQLRFNPILKIEARVADFQDIVRGRFPRYEESESQQVELSPEGIRLRAGKDFRFMSAEPVSMLLGDGAVALEYRAYDDREVLRADVDLMCEATQRALAPVTPIRLGLRYVNTIDQTMISQDLRRDVAWSELVGESFLRVPGNLTDLDGTRFATELSSPMPLGGMTVRCGLLPAPVPKGLGYRLDVDRYRDDSFALDSVPETLTTFADDIFQVFAAARGPALAEWMEG